jgi:hypothetical protein
MCLSAGNALSRLSKTLKNMKLVRTNIEWVGQVSPLRPGFHCERYVNRILPDGRGWIILNG